MGPLSSSSLIVMLSDLLGFCALLNEAGEGLDFDGLDHCYGCAAASRKAMFKLSLSPVQYCVYIL